MDEYYLQTQWLCYKRRRRIYPLVFHITLITIAAMASIIEM